MRTPALAACFLILALPTGSPAAQEPPAAEDHAWEELLVLPPAARGGRSPVVLDPVLAARVEGPLAQPTAGVPGPGTERPWRAIRRGEDGWFRDRALRRGWAFAAIDSDSSRIALLDASGHRYVVVNGVPRAGDPYQLGRARLPIALQAGRNELWFAAGRGRLRAALTAAPAPTFVSERGHTLPHILRGEGPEFWAGIAITNASDSWQLGLTLRIRSASHTTTQPLPPLAPLAVQKVAVPITATPGPDDRQLEVEFAVLDRGTDLHRRSLKVEVRDPARHHIRTFVSAIDGGVQYYGVTPPSTLEGAASPALFLSLHGAGVEAGHQASCYRPKPDGFVVAPTNRGRFGFDWEDWGRLDALEVLAEAEARFSTDPRRTYLTGHSMGGHGTWNLGSHFPDRFAAIAPSAGWRDFWSYGGAADWNREDPVQAIMARAVAGSRTLELRDNLLGLGVYVLHGDRDKTVPVAQARFMRQELAKTHPNFAYYERAGGGHWWGNECMDWPPLFDFLRQNVRAEAHRIRQVEFTSIHPGLSARCDWVTLAAQQRPFERTHIALTLDPGARKITGRTENATRLVMDLREFARTRTRETQSAAPVDETVLPAGAPVGIELDGDTIEHPWPEDQVVRLQRGGAGWRPAEPWSLGQKGPHRSGPFKDVFRHRVALVVGTQGDDAENRGALAKARYDAEQFGYRGNGALEILLDVAFDPQAHPDRNVVLYGNADTNAAWPKVLAGAPIDVRRGVVRVGSREFVGDHLACLFVFPRADSDIASVGVVADTGRAGRLATEQLPYFVSGVAYPDWIVIGADMLHQGIEGLRAAGFFDVTWSLSESDSAWRG